MRWIVEHPWHGASAQEGLARKAEALPGRTAAQGGAGPGLSLARHGAGDYMPANSIPFFRITAPKARSRSPEAQRTASGCDETRRMRCRNACEP